MGISIRFRQYRVGWVQATKNSELHMHACLTVSMLNPQHSVGGPSPPPGWHVPPHAPTPPGSIPSWVVGPSMSAQHLQVAPHHYQLCIAVTEEILTPYPSDSQACTYTPPRWECLQNPPDSCQGPSEGPARRESHCLLEDAGGVLAMVFCVLSKSECLEGVQEYLELLKFFLKFYIVDLFLCE